MRPKHHGACTNQHKQQKEPAGGGKAPPCTPLLLPRCRRTLRATSSSAGRGAAQRSGERGERGSRARPANQWPCLHGPLTQPALGARTARRPAGKEEKHALKIACKARSPPMLVMAMPQCTPPRKERMVAPYPTCSSGGRMHSSSASCRSDTLPSSSARETAVAKAHRCQALSGSPRRCTRHSAAATMCSAAKGAFERAKHWCHRTHCSSQPAGQPAS